ncbi:tetratricopeptide repeat protein [Rubinisphaera sp.]|uniref:tetratricopeptide repeat protein n=1 Tax=Rubinisphaera sp. TaxID=2024857 RepID=UPI000C109433|nr:tetratricopeptide repeat protein [Rubinisphaera sp.]MBV09837.1 hypothetical protein [Rubinisphaera sp.]HCS50832.1 hypothetical protein [Planctomycetaceae bacterium]|tara:strand:+ start:75 stop:473 length:399 start_codon:yes stop_codon:yes gene_type:complete
MNNDKLLIQIRNGIYLLCLINLAGMIVAIFLNIYLTNYSIHEANAMSVEASSMQTEFNELNDLLESNQLNSLISRCIKILEEKPNSGTAHYYLGLAFYQMGDEDESRKHLEESLKLEPSWEMQIQPYLEKLK